MIYRFFCMVLISIVCSLTAFAQKRQAPVSDGVFGCFSRVEQGVNSNNLPLFETMFVYRNDGFVVDPFGFQNQGKMVAVSIERHSSQWGITSYELMTEGASNLPDRENEVWSYPSPEGTKFTARGNLRGFFLYFNELGNPMGLYVESLFRKNENQVVQLNCTTSEAELARWYQMAKEDAKSIGALDMTNWKD